MALIDDFKTRFTEFDTAIVDTYLPILETVYPAYYVPEYDSTNARRKETILNLIAHLLTEEVRTSKSVAQVVASKSVGSVSTSFAAATQAGGQLYDAFNTTKYGQRFLVLIRTAYGGCAV
jgi:hypothetical protein